MEWTIQSNAELLDLILGARGKGEEILREVPSLYAAGHAVRSLTRRQREKVAAAVELGRRALSEQVDRGAPISGPRDVVARVQPILAGQEVELFIVLTLNSRNLVLSETVISKGSADRTLVNPRDVYREAVRQNSVGAIVCHNHPSGDPEPSPEDLSLTRRLAEAGRVVSVQLLDHIVLGGQSYVSLRERGAL